MKEATVIDWTICETSCKDRPYGLTLSPDNVMLSPKVRTKLFRIAERIAGLPALIGTNYAIYGRWISTHDARTWSFDTEGTRTLFLLATKGDTDALSC